MWTQQETQIQKQPEKAGDNGSPGVSNVFRYILYWTYEETQGSSGVSGSHRNLFQGPSSLGCPIDYKLVCVSIDMILHSHLGIDSVGVDSHPRDDITCGNAR